MGKYITHENLPFRGNLTKIRIRSYRMSPPPIKEYDAEQLLEITRDGTVKLTNETLGGVEKVKKSISTEDTDYIFAALVEVFGNYQKERIPSAYGYWKVRLLADDNEVFFYHGANGQDYHYNGESLTDILRQRTGMQDLFALNAKMDTKSKVASIEISYEQTAPAAVKEKYASEYGIQINDTNEWLLINAVEGKITYNRRIANKGRTSLQYELKSEVAEFLKWFEEEELFTSTQGNPANVVQDDAHKVYRITITHDGGKKVIRSGTFDKNDLPGDWGDFISHLRDFISAESFGELFNARSYNKVPRGDDEVIFCGVEIDGVVKTRYYRCGDDVCVGDFVEVPTPMRKVTAIGKVVEIRHCKKDAPRNEIEKSKPIIRKMLLDDAKK